MTAREVQALLVRYGWVYTRSNGSHFHYKKAGVKAIVTVPCHAEETLSLGVLKSIYRITGIQELCN